MCRVVACVLITVSLAITARIQAEFPALETAFSNPIKKFVSDKLKQQKVLVSLDESLKMRANWRLAAAIETEIVEQLVKLDIQAVDDDTDHRFRWLKPDREIDSTVARWQDEPVYEFLLLGVLRPAGDNLKVFLAIYDREGKTPIAKTQVILTAEQISLEANVPDPNVEVVEFVARHEGKPIGNGTCWTAAKDALAAAQAKRIGLYGFGRQLGPNEAVLPGDILQFEKVKFKGKFHKGKGLSMNHHTAIVSEVVDENRVKILHQNYGRDRDRIVGGELALNEVREGTLVISRPFVEQPVLPISLMPYRMATPKPRMKSSGVIDLLGTLDPQLDSIKGIWNKVGKKLTCHKDVACKLQIPVDLPESYVIRGEIKRIFADNAYVIVLVVDGQQVILTMDGFKGDQTTGLGLVDGKKENANETTYTGKIFPMNESVEIEITVTPDSIVFVADNKEIINWSGDASRLSISKTWQVPNSRWLALGCYMAEFETSRLTLEELN